MLELEKKDASQLGYDKPSPKLLSFLAKHYSLRNYSPQSNNFVVYDDYFRNSSSSYGAKAKLAANSKMNKAAEVKDEDLA